MVCRLSAVDTEFPINPTPRPNALADDNSEFGLCIFKVLNKGDVGFIVRSFSDASYKNKPNTVSPEGPCA